MQVNREFTQAMRAYCSSVKVPKDFASPADNDKSSSEN